MSTGKPSNQPDDFAPIRESLSPGVLKSALANRVSQHPAFFEFLWKYRFWWVVASAVTFVLPVLYNDNLYTLSYSGSANLYGFDLLVPVSSSTAHSGAVTIYDSFSINPQALIIYGLIGLQLYLFFVGKQVSARLVFWHGLIQTVATVLFPVLDIPVLNLILRGFNSHWHLQPPLFGFWVLLLAGLALWGGAYYQLLKSAPAHPAPPPLP
jgi:hypothetical protein